MVVVVLQEEVSAAKANVSQSSTLSGSDSSNCSGSESEGSWDNCCTAIDVEVQLVQCSFVEFELHCLFDRCICLFVALVICIG